MSEDVAVTASTFLNGTPPSHFRDLKKEWAAATAAAAASSATTIPSSGAGTMSSNQNNNGASGGQMMTFSPPAGDGAGTTGSTAPEATSSVSDLSGDAEGVWSIDIDQAFQEALAIYPPCGRRKIIISDEGKMYGRNELIARYIKLRCGKTRTRKQVSSHIQVLARKKMRDEQARKKSEPCLPIVSTSLSSNALSLSSSSIPQPSSVMSISPTSSPSTPPKSIGATTLPQVSLPSVEQSAEQLSQQLLISSLQNPLWFQQNTAGLTPQLPFGVDLSQLNIPKTELLVETPSPHPIITSSSLSLLGFSAYVKCSTTGKRTELVSIDSNLEEETISISMFYDKYPDVLRQMFEKAPNKDIFFLAKCWANINVPEDVMNFQYAVDSCYSSLQKINLNVSTAACSFGEQVVEKIETYPPLENDGAYQFLLDSSPMCDYMVKFITELKKLDDIEYMNSVLKNFTVLQIVTNKETSEPLMVLCFVFEVSQESDPSCKVFRLVA